MSGSSSAVPVPPRRVAQPVGLRLLVRPVARYDTATPELGAVATLAVDAPDLLALCEAYAAWLLDVWSGPAGTWAGVPDRIGTGWAPPPAGWGSALAGFLATDVAFTITGDDGPGEPPPAAFPMLDSLRLAHPGAAAPVVFADTARTDPGYAAALGEHAAALASLDDDAPVLTAEPDRSASLTRLVSDAWFLAVARRLAGALAGGPASLPDAAVAAAAGELGSRYLLGGLRVPDPAAVPPRPAGGVYALTGQQFAADPAAPVITATLSAAPAEDDAPRPAVTFAGGTSATATVPTPALPASFAPAVTVTALPPAEPREQWTAQRTRLPWQRPDGESVLVPLPPEVRAAAAASPVTLTVRPDEPGAPLPFAPALRVPVRVEVMTGRPYVYRVAVDDGTARARVAALLARPDALDGAAVSVLYAGTSGGWVSDALDQDAHPVVLVTTSPAATGPVAATPADPAGLLRLVAEASGCWLRYRTAAGDPLPPRLFGDGEPAALVLLVTFAAGAPVAAWHDAVAVSPPPAAGTLHLGTARDGVPVTALAPVLPPGCVAFETTVDTPDGWVGELYRLRVVRVVAGNGFGASPWCPAPAVVPVYRRLAGSGEPAPYDAVGRAPSLDVTLADPFGNVLPGATATTFDVRYADPLLPPQEWPGMRVAYGFVPAAPGRPAALELRFEADPATFAAGTPARYAVAAAQLADPRTTVSLASTLSPDGPVGDPAMLKAALASLVADVGTAPPEPVRRTVPVPVAPADLVRAGADLLPVRVTLTLSRPPDLVHADGSGATVPGSLTATAEVAADGDPVAFAATLERTYDGFDGGDGTVRVAAPATGDSVWVLRCGTKTGVDVTFDQSAAAYFSLAPLGLAPVGGAARVPAYDADLRVTYADRTFAGIDLDDWARMFLAAVDGVLAPDVATAIAAVDPVAYGDLVAAKATVAAALAGRVVPVFAGGDRTGLVAGDLDTAREHAERAARATLSAAYTTSAVVQVPATVSATGAGPAGPPRLLGDVTATGAVGASAATLPLASGPGLLTVVTRVTAPVTDVVTSLAYDAWFVEQGERLRFAVAPLSRAAGTPDVPAPVRAYPAPPVAVAQTATQGEPPEPPDPVALAPYLCWDYTAEVRVAPTDRLVVDVTYGTATGPPVTAVAAPPGGSFAVLAAFVAAWETLGPLVPGIARSLDTGPDGGPPAANVVAAVRERVVQVAGAWAEPPAAGPPAAAATGSYVVDFAGVPDGRVTVHAAGPEPIGWPFVDGAGPLGPATPRADRPGWYARTYPYVAGADQVLTLAWRDLDLTATRGAVLSCAVVRNESLSAVVGRRTDPAFVYRTPRVSFPDPAVPLVVVPPLGPVPPAATLCRTLCATLAPLAAATGSGLSLRAGVAYDYELASEPGGPAVRASLPVLVMAGVALQPGGDCTGCDAGTPAPGTLCDVARRIAGECVSWHAGAAPPDTGAALVLSATLFAEVAGTSRPVLDVPAVTFTVSPAWWTA